MATLFNISKSSAWEFTHSVSSAIVEAMVRSYVHFPTGDRKARIIAKFHQICGLDNVVGALDGCHIPIMSPKHDKRDYIDRKSGNSVIISAVADSRCSFIHLSVGYPGSMHDLTILRSSPLWHVAEVERHPYFQQHRILGDSGYRSAPDWLILPHQGDELTEEQRRFNFPSCPVAIPSPRG